MKWVHPVPNRLKGDYDASSPPSSLDPHHGVVNMLPLGGDGYGLSVLPPSGHHRLSFLPATGINGCIIGHGARRLTRLHFRVSPSGMKELIRDRTGRVIGFLYDSATRVQIHGADNVVLGWFDKNSKSTHSRDGRLIGFGNQVLRLLSD